VIPVDAGNCTCGILAGKAKRLEEVADESPVVPLEILNVQRGVEWPVVAFDVKYFAQRAVASSYDARTSDFGFIVRSRNPR
jgi:hypothetical protein